MKVKGKVCVVTGAAGGIGEAIARRYAKEGAKGVVVADMDQGRLEKVAKEIGGPAVSGVLRQGGPGKRLTREARKKNAQSIGSSHQCGAGPRRPHTTTH